MKNKNLDLALIFLIFLLVNTGLQFHLGAQTSEFWHTDDGSHFISGVLILQWIRSGFPSPMAYAYDFNAHFPVVGIGLWGPAFYVVEGIWGLIFGASKGAALLLSAAVGASISTAIYAVSKGRSNAVYAAVFAAMFCVAPLGIEGTVSYGLDLPMSLFCLLSALVFANYLAREQRSALALFTFLALFCLFIKGNGLALGLFVPLAILLTNRHHLFLRVPLWVSGATIAAIALPWYLLTFKMSASGFRHAWGIDFFLHAVPQNAALIIGTLGFFMLPLLIIGIVRTLTTKEDLLGRTLLALFLAIFLFQSLVPASLNGRYLLPMLAPALIFCADGWFSTQRFLAQRLPMIKRVPGFFIPLMLLASFALLKTADRKEPHGLIEAAREIQTQPQLAGKPILIGAFDVGETAFITEMAMALNGKPDVYVIRGSRLLGGGGYNNFEYSTPYESVEAVAKRLNEFKIPYLVVTTDGRAKEWRHVVLLDEMVNAPAQPWKLLWRYGGSADVRVYVNPEFASTEADPAQIRALTQPKKMSQ